MSLGLFWRRYLGTPLPRAHVPEDFERRLARLIHAGRTKVGRRWGSAYRSAFRGEGLEFAGVRHYQPGDDTRALDWRVWARTGVPAVRQYVEERDRRVWLLVDVGAESECGSGGSTLRELAGETVAVLGSAAMAAGDRVGLLAWGRRREILLPPQRDRGSLSRMVRSLLSAPADAYPWDAARAIEDLRRLAPRRAVVAMISPRLESRELVTGAARLARSHQLLFVRTWDPLAGVGQSTARIPARRADGRTGRAASGVPPVLPPLPGPAMTLVPGRDVAAILARTLAAGREGPNG